jgi:hypothetical protein
MNQNKLSFIVCMLIPGAVEAYLYQSECMGNFAIHGVWLGIYMKRNFLYFSLFILLSSYLINYFYYGLFFSIYILYLYVKTCNEWYDIIIMPK